MIDPTSLVVGAGLFATGLLTGKLTRRRTPAADTTPKAVCGCSHGLEQHNPDTNECHGQMRRDKHNKFGDWIGHEWVPCTCRQYVGPRPLEELYAPPVLPPRDTL